MFSGAFPGYLTEMEHTYVLVVYDIEKTKFRTKVAEACKDAGLVRVQLSVFMGEMEPDRRPEFFAQLKSKLSPTSYGRVMLLPISQRCLGGKMEAIIIGDGGKADKLMGEETDIESATEVGDKSDRSFLASVSSGGLNL